MTACTTISILADQKLITMFIILHYSIMTSLDHGVGHCDHVILLTIHSVELHPPPSIDNPTVLTCVVTHILHYKLCSPATLHQQTHRHIDTYTHDTCSQILYSSDHKHLACDHEIKLVLLQQLMQWLGNLLHYPINNII